MNKELLLKLGFESTLSDELLEESWNRLIKFFETEEVLRDKANIYRQIITKTPSIQESDIVYADIKEEANGNV